MKIQLIGTGTIPDITNKEQRLNEKIEIIDYINLNNRFTNNQIHDFINTCMYEFLNRPFKELKDIIDINGYYIKNGGNFWIAIDKDIIIGIIALENRGNIGILKRLYIKKEYQHKGIGTNLYNTFEEYVKEKTNIKTIYLACGRVLENAHKFYVKNGFKKIDNLEIEMHTVEGDDFFKKEIK